MLLPASIPLSSSPLTQKCANGIIELVVAVSHDYHHGAAKSTSQTTSSRPPVPTFSHLAASVCSRCSCPSELVRVRAAFALCRLLSHVGGSGDSATTLDDVLADDDDDEAFRTLVKTCRNLARDKSAAVRQQGLRLAGLLQDMDEGVRRQILESVNFDPSPVVRAVGLR